MVALDSHNRVTATVPGTAATPRDCVTIGIFSEATETSPEPLVLLLKNIFQVGDWIAEEVIAGGIWTAVSSCLYCASTAALSNASQINVGAAMILVIVSVSNISRWTEIGGILHCAEQVVLSENEWMENRRVGDAEKRNKPTIAISTQNGGGNDNKLHSKERRRHGDNQIPESESCSKFTTPHLPPLQHLQSSSHPTPLMPLPFTSPSSSLHLHLPLLRRSLVWPPPTPPPSPPS